MNRISTKIVADSKTEDGDRITTMEVIFPRYILAEFNTHRLFSRNSASSRAIPFKKMLKTVENETFIPIAWQEDHSGMQGTKYLDEGFAMQAVIEWIKARDYAVSMAKQMHESTNVTKQLVNRILEPFMYHKVLVTATEFENFFNLRCPQYEYRHIGNEGRTSHLKNFKSRKEWLEYNDFVGQTEGGDNIGNVPKTDLEWLQINKGMGEIHIMDLAEKMYDAMNESTPKLLKPGEWHIPYGDMIDLPPTIPIEEGYTLEEGVIQRKLKIAIARCARLSYQTLGDNPVIDYTKDLELYETLKESGHYSPFEHVAKVMTEDEYSLFTKGKLNETESITGEKIVVNDGTTEGWCNNFRGFIQYRWILENTWR